MTTPWLKVLIDLWEHRGRTLVVALAVAVGVFAVGSVLNTREIVVREYERDKVLSRMASAIIFTEPFDADLAESIGKLPLVAAADARASATGRVRLADGSTQEIDIVAIPDFENLGVDAILPVSGAFPPGRREALVEGASLDSLETPIGGEITVEMSNDAVRPLRLAGTIHDPQRFSPTLSGVATLYVTPETFESLGYPGYYTEMRIRATDPAQDEAHIMAALDQVEARLNESGRTILARQIVTEAVADPYIGSVVLILTVFGIIILVLSTFLVVNSVSALITQQVPQIGVMKLIGATRRQIMALYMATVLIYGVIAVIIALPLALLMARMLMGRIVVPLLNVQVASYDVPATLLLAQVALGLILPLVAGLSPVMRGTRVTTHQALNDVGMGGAAYGRSMVERLIEALQRVRRIERPVLLAIRNTLRHKGRLVQTLIVLIFGTALFVSVLSVRSSVNATLDTFMRFHRYDVSVEMEGTELVTRLEDAAADVPGVAAAEVWSIGSARRVFSGEDKSNAFRVVAAPAGTTMMEPKVLEGEWLSEGQGVNALIINSDLADDQRDLRVGSEVTLDIDGRESTWRVAGIVSTESRGPTAYAALADYAYASRATGEGNRLQVRMDPGAALSQQEMGARLRESLDAAGLKVRETRSASMTQTENSLLFSVVVAFLILMALLLAAVGGLGLTTTMSINMMERVREVGVLRAIGASNASVRRIVLAEGIAMAVISWIVGVALSIGLAPVFSSQLGLVLIKIPLQYHYSLPGAIVWFFVLIAIAAAASLAPARNAVRLTVREVLAYE